MSKPKPVFVKGAWLCSLDEELTEAEFIEKAGGIEALKPYRDYLYVSLILDPKGPHLVGHYNGKTIALSIQGRTGNDFQTMEWVT